MVKKLLLKLATFLYRLTYEPITLDKINRKLVRPVPGLVIEGVQYYEFVNLSDMPQGRMVHYNYMREEMIMGIDRQLQTSIIDKILKACDDKDNGRVAALCFMFKDIINNITSVESLYNVASVAYFDKTEDIATYDMDYNNRKISGFKAMKDKSFFFEWVLRETLRNSGDSLPSDIQKFLNENAAKLNLYKQMLSGKEELKD